MAQDLRQIGGAELTGSTRAVGESSETNAWLLVDRGVGHRASGERIESRSLSLLLYPDQRSQRDQRPFLLGGGAEATIGPLPRQQGRHSTT
jgi:hypothetical protein